MLWCLSNFPCSFNNFYGTWRKSFKSYIFNIYISINVTVINIYLKHLLTVGVGLVQVHSTSKKLLYQLDHLVQVCNQPGSEKKHVNILTFFFILCVYFRRSILNMIMIYIQFFFVSDLEIHIFIFCNLMNRHCLRFIKIKACIEFILAWIYFIALIFSSLCKRVEFESYSGRFITLH